MNNKTIKIGLSCSPSRILSHEKIETSKILVSYGGGMGGANEKHYCTKVVRDEKLWKLTLLTGEVIEVNPEFIVEVAPRTLVKVVSDITEHRNYHSKTCKLAIETEYIGLHFGEDYAIANDFKYRGDGELQGRLVSKDIVITDL